AARPWPGDVGVWQSVDRQSYDLDNILTATVGVGVTLSPLRRHVAGIFDQGEALVVRMSTGRGLQSVSDSRLFVGENTIAIGDGTAGLWEILQFRDAVLIAPDVYELRLRLRGQLGTDAIMPVEWPTGSKVVVVDNRLRQMTISENLRGASLDMRFGSLTRGPDDASATAVSFEVSGNGLRPYPVAHLRTERASNGDVSCRWVRRTRLGGDSWLAIEVPLAEEVELYQVDVMQGGELVRRVFSNVTTWSYSVGQQVTDGVSAPFHVRVSQVSQAYGPGPYREVSQLA
ncbi:MAG: phage tail baseplate protein, partial [Paracoccaceae bacterium]